MTDQVERMARAIARAMSDVTEVGRADIDANWPKGWEDERRKFMASAHAAIAEIQQWQPIATAEEDEEPIILGYIGSDGGFLVAEGHWQEAEPDGIDYMGADAGFVDEGYQYFHPGRSFGADKYRNPGCQPTHWMPLPEPPEN